MNSELPSYHFQPVAIVRSCFKTKFGIPRQPGLISEARGSIELLPPYNQPNAVRGLEDFSHIWVLFVFHDSLREGWKATVRPPRLGGDKRIGVFASRSPFRPCPIGLSVLKLCAVRLGGHGKIALEVEGLDLLDGTPVLDIKPYLPYTDAISDARAGFAPSAPPGAALPVQFSDLAAQQAASIEKRGLDGFRRLAEKVIAADPRPAYQREPGRVYGIFLHGYEVVWEAGEDSAVVTHITRDATPPPSKRKQAQQAKNAGRKKPGMDAGSSGSASKELADNDTHGDN
jgi:tRNA-Thr(GGU) m(6)t(6)A37 methyltransferase TsaA